MPLHVLDPRQFLIPIPLDDSNPAHRVLFNRDIFEPIARILYNMEESDGRIALARLARTCRGFFYDSIAVLWETMDSIAPLLRTIRGLDWEVVFVDKDKGLARWVRHVVYVQNWITSAQATVLQNVIWPDSPTDCSLTYFTAYASHIKHLVWTDGGVTPATFQLFVGLAGALQGPLLPHLQSFDDYSVTQPPPLALLPAALRRVTFSPSNFKLENDFLTVLDVIPSWFPDLEELYLEGFQDSRGLPAHEQEDDPSDVAIDRYIGLLKACLAHAMTPGRSYANLHTIESNFPLTGAHFISLAYLPRLTSLITQVGGLDSWPPERFPAASFPAIRVLVLDFVFDELASPLAKIIEKIASTHLEVLDVTFHGVTAEDPKLARELFQIIAHSPFRNALEDFSFALIAPVKHVTPGPPVFTMDAFSPLLLLPNLTGLRITTPVISLRSNDIYNLASAWINLQDIQFTQDSRSLAAVHVESLKAFADKCPQLQRIGFDVMPPAHLAPRASLMLDAIKPSLSVVENECCIISGIGDSFSSAFVYTYLNTLFPEAPCFLQPEHINATSVEV